MRSHSNQQKWAFRVASHPRHGGGHLARCTVLADALLALNAHVTFVLDEGSNAIVEILKARGLSIVISGRTSQGSGPGVFLDGYKILEDESSYWHSVAPQMVVIDDFLKPPKGTSLVINCAPHAEGTQVGGMPALLGPRYALVSPKFAALPCRDRSQDPEHVLISFGRLDPQDLDRADY